MPARTRAVRAPKAPKENVDILAKTKAKNGEKSTKAVRKPLADKTNSASDENASPEPIKKVIKKANKPSQNIVPVASDEDRPRRNRRLPPRYVENEVLTKLSNSKENATIPKKSPNKTPVKRASNVESPFKTPTTVLDNSLSANRPKRVSRLPSKFEDNSVSPYKFLPTHCHTSTPLVPKVQEKTRDVKKTLGNKHRLATQELSDNGISSQINTKLRTNKVSPRKDTVKKSTPQKASPRKVVVNKVTLQRVTPRKVTPHKKSPQKAKVAQKKLVQKKLSEVVKNIDTNRNERQARVRRLRKPVEYKDHTVSPKLKSPDKPTNLEVRKILKTNSSFRVFEDKESKSSDNQDIYEFTFDPTEEPPPQKKKKKKVTAKKPAKPKTRVYKNNYEKNIARALADLKNVVTKNKPEVDKVTDTSKPTNNPDYDKVTETSKPTNNPGYDKVTETSKPTNNPEVKPAGNKTTVSAPITSKPTNNPEVKPAGNKTTVSAPITSKPTNNPEVKPGNKTTVSAPNPSSIVISTVAEIHPDPSQNASNRSNASTKNHVSYRVEDIAADFDASADLDDINYSPVISPRRIEKEPEICPTSPEQARPDDPLNLRNDLSFFNEQPVANSSMNASKNPMATPWRAEFENLPIKWQANTYVKPDMTPALECSFVNNFDDSKKKHVYTNMVAQSNDALPEIEENQAPKLKQTSIISFIKEVIERSASKKKRGASTTPTKANSLFDMPDMTTRSVATPRKETSNSSVENESSESTKAQKRKNNVDNNPTPAKIPRKDNENTLFGFDDSENQENVSPVKIVSNNRLRSLRSRSGAVLKELNKQSGPMRAELPAAMKAKLAPSSDAVEKIYDQMKSAADAPMLLDRHGDAQVTNIEDAMEDDSQSVHLFEDIELVHHLKPTRKSYGKAKKVTFQNSSDSASEDEAPRNQSSDDDVDNLEDLSFHLPEVKTKKKAGKKKKTKKQMLLKKEKAEVDAWAACFNSMCEDIEEFDLVVE